MNTKTEQPLGADMALITSCSSTRTVEPIVKVGDMPRGLNMTEAFEWWAARLEGVKPERQLTAGEIYRGLGFYTLTKITDRFGIKDSYIVTGGQGLIQPNDKIAPYDFLGSKGHGDNIHDSVTKEPFVPTIWWRWINNWRHKQTDPIAALPHKTIIVALPKPFLKYVIDDLLAHPDPSRIRIMLSASNLTSVVAQVRSMCVPFTREALDHLPGNRNDGAQRAAMAFLEKVEAAPDLLTLSNSDSRIQNLLLGGRSFDTAKGNGNGSKLTREELKEWLEENSEVLELDEHSAYRRARGVFGTFGGYGYFCGVFREAKGITIEADESAQEDAAAALSGLSFIKDKPVAVAGDNNETQALTDVATFVEAVKKMNAGAVFSASDIVEWSEKYYGAKNNGATRPPQFTSANHLTTLLKENQNILGIKAVKLVGSSGNYYRIADRHD